MNYNPTSNPAESTINAIRQSSADWMSSTQHVRNCCAEVAYATASDYKDFYENLRNVSDPKLLLSTFNNHLQKRFLHTVQNWQHLQIAMTQAQVAVLPKFQHEMPVAGDKNGSDPVYETYSFMNPMNSALNYMNALAQSMRGDDDETVEAEDVVHKVAPLKNGKSHTNRGAHLNGKR